MLVLILSSVVAAFIGYFYLLGLWYLGLIPLFLLLFFLFQLFSETQNLLSKHDFFNSYGLYLVTLLAFLGIAGISSFLGFSENSIISILGIVFWILWYLSYIIPYPDGKKLFGNFFALSIVLWILSSIFGGFDRSIWPILLTGNSIALVALFVLIFVIGKLYSFETKFNNLTIILSLSWILLLVMNLVDAPLLALNINLTIYLGFLLLLDYIKRLKTTRVKEESIGIRELLDGKKILGKTKVKEKTFLDFLLTLKDNSPALNVSFEGINIWLLFLLIAFYFSELLSGNLPFGGYYWMGIGLFIWNGILLKKNQIFGNLSRFSIALIINFSILLGIILAKNNSTELMLPRLIAWNIFCGVLIFYSQLRGIKPYIKKTDLISWIITTWMATLVNLFLLSQAQLSGQLLFSLGFFYLGVQGFIGYYAIKLIIDFKESEKSDPQIVGESLLWTNSDSSSYPKDSLDQLLMDTLRKEL